MNISEQMNLVIVGHVDHGKSTIIGRLLADTNSLPQGKLQQVRDLCERNSKPFEYAFLLDALKDEQAQGITIDAARIFFQSEKRRYLILDAPGHIEFLKNMITGASRADAALLVIDAQEGIRENSRRHAYMLSMLGIKSVAILVNKMDLVGYSQDRFTAVREEYDEFLQGIGIASATYVPVSGLTGDNVAGRSDDLPWHKGLTVLEVLDSFTAKPTDRNLPFRMPVQDVYKFTRFGDSRRIVAGTVATGILRLGDNVVFYPSGKTSRVRSLESFPAAESPEASIREEVAGSAIGFTLDEQIYVTRGELATRAGERPPLVSRRLRVSLFWLGREPMRPEKDYLLRLGTAKVKTKLERVGVVIDASTLARKATPEEIGRHDVAECVLHCEQSVAFDLSADMTETGRFVLIDDYEIAGGGIVLEALEDDQSRARERVLVRNLKWEKSAIGRLERTSRYGQKAALVVITGALDSNKKDLAKALETQLFNDGRLTYYLGIGNLLYGVDADLKRVGVDSKVDHREEHVRRFAEVAHLMLEAGMILIATAVELTTADLEIMRTILETHDLLVFWAGEEVTTGLDVTAQFRPGLAVGGAVAEMKTALQDAGIVFRGE